MEEELDITAVSETGYVGDGLCRGIFVLFCCSKKALWVQPFSSIPFPATRGGTFNLKLQWDTHMKLKLFVALDHFSEQCLTVPFKKTLQLQQTVEGLWDGSSEGNNDFKNQTVTKKTGWQFYFLSWPGSRRVKYVATKTLTAFKLRSTSHGGS